jgi:hypothetical protein
VIEEIRFSDRSESVTDFEQRLLAQSRSSSVWLQIARRAMQELGVASGSRALAIFLDEVGGEVLRVPDRKCFFRALWRLERDRLIVDLAARPDWTYPDIGAALGVSKQYVSKVVGRQPRVPRVPGEA